MSDAAACSDDLTSYLAAHEPFCDLDPATLAELGRTLELVCLPAGQVLFQQGDPGDSLYVLLAGRLSVVIAAHAGAAEAGAVEVDQLAPGVTVGEMALLSGQPRSATVTALADCELIRVSDQAFHRLADRRPDAVARLTTGIAPRIHRAELAGVLSRLFGALDAPTLYAVQSELIWRTLAGGEVLFRQGDPADHMYLVIHGRIGLYLEENEGRQRLVNEVVRGDVLGEMGLLTAEPRTLTARAARDSIVAALGREAFNRVIARHPHVMTEIARLAFHRQRSSVAGPNGAASATGAARPDAVFALVPVAAGAPVSICAEQLTASLAQLGRVLHLTSRNFDDRYGRPGLSQLTPDHPIDALLVARLSEIEREYRYVVYEADPEPTDWSRRCVRQADRVLLVGQGGDKPPRPESPVDALLHGRGETLRCELLLVQPASQPRPAGTAAWLDRFPAAAEHHHVRLDVQEDWARAVRRLTGRATGLVLSGGGARGLVHVGVWRALLEARVPVDFFGGTSMGAIVAGVGAMGMDYDETVAAAAELLTPPHLFDPTLPVVSFLTTGKITASLARIYGDAQIEDLWRPFFAVATNLGQGAPVTQRRGSLAHAVRASMAVPGIFAPVCHEGEVYVDGGVLNNLPIDVMHRLLHGGKIIAVNAWPEADLVRDYCFGDSVSGWRALIDRVNPLNEKQGPPLLFETIFRILSLGGAAQLPKWREMVDLYICPPVEDYSPLAFLNWRPLVEIGYRAAQAALTARQPAVGPTPARRVAAAQLHRTLDELEQLLARRSR